MTYSNDQIIQALIKLAGSKKYFKPVSKLVDVVKDSKGKIIGASSKGSGVKVRNISAGESSMSKESLKEFNKKTKKLEEKAMKKPTGLENLSRKTGTSWGSSVYRRVI